MNRTTLTIAGLCLLLAAPVLAQDRISKPPARRPAPAPTPAPTKPETQPPGPPQPGAGAELPPAAATELSPKPFRINSVGLSVRLPAGAQVQTTGAGELTSVQVMDTAKTWLINIRTPVTKTTRPAPEVALQVRDQLLASAPPLERTSKTSPTANTHARILHDIRPLAIKTESPVQARPASFFYVSIPRSENEAPILRGYAVFEVAAGRYATFDLTAPHAAAEAARAAFESCLKSVRFEDAVSADAARGTAVERGVDLLTSLTPEDYTRAIDAMKDQWFRLSRTDAEGKEQEIAYRHVRAWKGQRGEMDPARDPKKWTAADRQEGYMVRIDARILRDSLIVDSVGRFFMTPDRKEESWMVQMVVRDPKAKAKPNAWREIGARSGDSMNVITEGSGESKTGYPTVPDTGYITQVEAMLLPQLILLSKTPEGPAGEFGFYAFQSEDGKVMLRRDRVAPATDGIGAWTITTRLTEDREPQIANFSELGLLARNRLPDGSAWTPITLTKLADLWTSKRLPME